MNKKGTGPFTIMFIVIIFVIVWAMFLGGWLASWGQQAIILNNLTGIEAFVYANLNLLVGFCLVISTMGYLAFSSG